MARYNDQDIEVINAEITAAIRSNFPEYKPISSGGGYHGHGLRFLHKGMTPEGKLSIEGRVNYAAGTEHITVKHIVEGRPEPIVSTGSQPNITPIPLIDILNASLLDVSDPASLPPSKKRRR